MGEKMSKYPTAIQEHLKGMLENPIYTTAAQEELEDTLSDNVIFSTGSQKEIPTLSVSVSWNPTYLSNLQLWLKSDIGVSETNASVYIWEDQSSNSYTFFQTNVGAEPILVPDVVNEIDILRFDGANSYLATSTADIMGGGTPGGEFTAFAVAALNASPAAYGAFISTADEGTDWHHILYLGISDKNVPTGADSRPTVYVYEDGSVNQDNLGSPTNSYGDTDFHIYTYDSDDSTHHMWVDGVSQSIIAQGNANNGAWLTNVTGRDNTTIGAVEDNDLARYFKGDIAEIIVYNTCLGQSDRESVEGYLSSRYDITI